MRNVLIIGGGPAGCCAAHQISLLKQDYKITLIEKSNFLGGGCKTLYFGGHPYTFGPRHFLTNKKYLFDFLNQFVPMRSCHEHEFITYVEQDDNFYNYPINEDDIKIMPDYNKINVERQNAIGPKGARNLEEYWINSVGKTLFSKFIENYNKKMWLMEDLKELDTFNWSEKGPSIQKSNDKPFVDMISAYPIKLNGYDDYFDVATKGSKVLLNTTIEKYDLQNKNVFIKGEKHHFDVIVNTLPPDEIFDFKFGKLPFIGRDFYPFVLPIENIFPKDIYFIYSASNNKVTRCVEYKKLTKYKSKNSLIGIEIPTMSNRLYPMPITKYQKIADKYFDLMPEGVYSVGRAGIYRYGVDFDRCIDHGMLVAKDLKNNNGGGGSINYFYSKEEQV